MRHLLIFLLKEFGLLFLLLELIELSHLEAQDVLLIHNLLGILCAYIRDSGLKVKELLFYLLIFFDKIGKLIFVIFIGDFCSLLSEPSSLPLSITAKGYPSFSLS